MFANGAHQKIDLKFEDGNILTYPVSGVFKYAQASGADSFCEPIEDADIDPFMVASAAIITESGTYCASGRRIGEAGMSDEDFIKLCSE